MTVWLNGIGCGWGNRIQHGLVIVGLWGAVTATVLGLCHFTRAQSNPSAANHTRLTRAEYLATEGSHRSDPDDGRWHCPLM
jgi:hypothetical protein